MLLQQSSRRDLPCESVVTYGSDKNFEELNNFLEEEFNCGFVYCANQNGDEEYEDVDSAQGEETDENDNDQKQNF